MREPAATLRYLSEADVVAAAPPAGEAIDLAATALRTLARGEAQLPPKAKLFPRAVPGGFTNAMPAYSSVGDLLGVKWVSAEPDNAARGLPVVHALMILSDAATGAPRCVMGARWFTGLRTAAVTGACLRALAPAAPGQIALIGTGLQARTHLSVFAALGHDDVVVWGHRPASVASLLTWSAEHAPTVRLHPAPTIEAAVREASAVVTIVTQGVTTTRLEHDWLRDDVLLLPVDYGTCVAASLADGATFLADDPAQFRSIRDAGGNLAGYRDPDGASGAFLDRGRPAGRVVVQNLGNGVADLFVADAVLRRAETLGVGHELPC